MFEEDRVTEQCGLYAGWGIGGGRALLQPGGGRRGSFGSAGGVGKGFMAPTPTPRNATPDPLSFLSTPRSPGLRRGAASSLK